MKLTREEFQRSKEQHPLQLFRQGIRSDQTLEKYERTLKWLLTNFLEDILEGTFEQRVFELVKDAKAKPDWARDLLLNVSKKLRERTKLPKDDPDYLSPNSFDNYFKPVKKLFDMNDVIFMANTSNWNCVDIDWIVNSSHLFNTRVALSCNGIDVCWGGHIHFCDHAKKLTLLFLNFFQLLSTNTKRKNRISTVL